ncbi:MAG: hypothetical protein IJW55_07330 [Clostridia bacterium]|nr:hypothetical protein [Clostridia bacterium]
MEPTYDERLINTYHEMIGHRNDVIKEKNKWIKTLFVCTIVLTAVIFGNTLFDIFNPNVGYVRY